MTTLFRTVVCADNYEAEKLASLMSSDKDGKINIDAIGGIHGYEVILRLRDKTSHSVLLNDGESVRVLESVLQAILYAGCRPEKVARLDHTVEIVLAN